MKKKKITINVSSNKLVLVMIHVKGENEHKFINNLNTFSDCIVCRKSSIGKGKSDTFHLQLCHVRKKAHV